MSSKFIHIWIFVALACFASCIGTDYKDYSEENSALMKDLSHKKNYPRIMHLADSLEGVGRMTVGESYYWQGYASYRMMQYSTAEFYWRSAIDATKESKKAVDIAYYAKSASYLVSMLCRFRDYENALKITSETTSRIENLQCDTTGDYANLLIFMGCSQKHFHMSDSAVSVLFNRAYRQHMSNIEKNPTSEIYKDAIAGVINMAYSCINERDYKEALVWTENMRQLVEQYKLKISNSEPYVDKQWARYKIFLATTKEGLGKRKEAARAFDEYQKSNFAETFEGKADACDYLVLAGRWDEAAQSYTNLNAHFQMFQLKFSLENIQRYLLKKHHANQMAGQNDTANVVANQICEHLDSAIIYSYKEEAEEQEYIRQKEQEIIEQQARLDRQLMYGAVVFFAIIFIALVVYAFISRRHSRRLAEKNEQLKIANARAEESSQMKTNFIQQISHEIRTPLNILSGFTQIITTPGMELEEEEREEINKGIVANTDRITGLVNKMLEMADASSQAVINCTDEVTAEQIAIDAIGHVGIAQREGVEFEYLDETEASTVIMHTSKQQAVRVLSLLLDNACKFLVAPLEKVSGTVRLRIRKDADKNNGKQTCVSFIVEDTGIGVPPEDAERIFDEFVQIDDYYDGTGIGLTVARSIARRMGGDVVLDTTYTSGARFVMTLPL